MNGVDLAVAAAGVAVTVAAIIVGAWFDLRPGKGDRRTGGEKRDAG